MQEIGTWTTAEGSVSATLQLESEMGDDVGQELPAWASGALSGALGGAATGAAAGPWGALIGAAAGATIGGVAAASQPAQPATPAGGKPPAAPTATAATPAPAAASSRDQAIRALQQFAAAVPALIQLVAASGQPATAKRAEFAGTEESFESAWADEGVEADNWASYAEDDEAWTIS